MKRVLAGVTLAVLVFGAALWYAERAAPQPDASADSTKGALNNAQSQQDSMVDTDSPFAVSEPGQVTVSNASASTDIAFARQSDADAPSSTSQNNAAAALDMGSAVSDAQFDTLVRQLKADASLVQQLIDEFRQEIDPSRKQRLGRLLGAVGGDEVVLIASELIFSGDNDSLQLGMRLLQKVQPENAQARELVSDVLATDIQPQNLINALSALAKPGNVDAQNRAYLADQVAFLTTHEDHGVRGVSLNILSRWSKDGRYTGTLLAGLDDDSEHVRSAATYALVSHEDQSAVVIERLFNVVRQPGELEAVKRGAILALESMPLTEFQVSELDALERQLNIVMR